MAIQTRQIVNYEDGNLANIAIEYDDATPNFTVTRVIVKNLTARSIWLRIEIPDAEPFYFEVTPGMNTTRTINRNQAPGLLVNGESVVISTASQQYLARGK